MKENGFERNFGEMCTISLLRRGFCFLKNRGKEGKAEKRERLKNGKGRKSAREREKRRKPLPDFCRNMAKVVDIRPHTA